MATIGVVWFSYRDDGELLQESLRAAQRTFEASKHSWSFYVFDDGMNPIDMRLRRQIEETYGEIYKKTFYPRGGNLLGPDNLRGQVEAMAEVGDTCDLLVKIDCDTLLLRLDWMEALLDIELNGGAVMAGSYKGLKNYPMGNCYAILTEGGKLTKRLCRDVEKFPAWTGCFEDYEIGTRLHRLCDGDDDYAIRYRSGIEDGFWLCNPHEVSNLAKQARVVSCGFGWTSCPKEKRLQYRKGQLMAMRMLNDDLEGILVQHRDTEVAHCPLPQDAGNDATKKLPAERVEE